MNEVLIAEGIGCIMLNFETYLWQFSVVYSLICERVSESGWGLWYDILIYTAGIAYMKRTLR